MTTALGTLGIWQFTAKATPELAVEAERLGYGTVWIGGSPDGSLEQAEALLDATERITVATGIVNMWKDDAATVAASYQRLEAKHPGRFLLGVGIGHLKSATMQPVVSPGSVVLAFGVSVLIGIFFGAYPASRAAALTPMEALRYE